MTASQPPEYKCPFSAPLISRQFGCVHSLEVIHRGGTEINCNAQAAQARCAALFQRLKQAALPAFGVEDDLLSMPHSVLVKIQYGGLLGLQQCVHTGVPAAERVEDIHALVETAARRFGEELHCEQLVGAITAFKPRARRGR